MLGTPTLSRGRPSERGNPPTKFTSAREWRFAAHDGGMPCYCSLPMTVLMCTYTRTSHLSETNKQHSPPHPMSSYLFHYYVPVCVRCSKQLKHVFVYSLYIDGRFAVQYYHTFCGCAFRRPVLSYTDQDIPPLRPRREPKPTEKIPKISKTNLQNL